LLYRVTYENIASFGMAFDLCTGSGNNSADVIEDTTENY